ncbi:MAG: hypothetical protein WBB28_08965 [Crinalium sp.]
MSTIKYQYGLDLNGQTINIEDLSQSQKVKKEIFRCLGCNNILVAVLGEKRKKHFRHKSDVEVNCSRETYLHKLAKLSFQEVYNNCLQESKPFWISFEINKTCNHYLEDFLQTCDWKTDQEKFDLTKYFKNVVLEKKEGCFIPDLRLSNDKGDKIFVEIAVTHQATKEKLQSPYRIIEINIDEEKDIQIINDRSLLESEKVKFINFKNNKSGDFCYGRCVKEIRPYASSLVIYIFFVIYNDGESCILSEDSTQFENALNSNLIAHYEIIAITKKALPIRIPGEIFIKKVQEAHLNKLPIKNCYLCHHHRLRLLKYKGNKVFCKAFRKSCEFNEAVKCKYYQVAPLIANENETDI